MQIVFQSGENRHVFDSDTAGGRILAAIARTLPQEVAAIAHNGTARHPEMTTRDELLAAIGVVLSQIEADSGLLNAYAVSVKAHGDERPAGKSFGRGSGLSGIRLPDTPADRAYALWCDPGRCDLVEMLIGPDGRGIEQGTVDLRGKRELLTANLGPIRIHARRAKTRLPEELQRLVAAVQAWPAGKVAKFVQIKK
jgi:hypothetical protein